MNKPSVLIFVEYYLPGYKSGGPVQSVTNLITLLREHYTVFLVTRDRDFMDTKPYAGLPTDVWLQRDGYQVMYRSAAKRTPWGTYQLLQAHSFDFIYANSLFGSFTHGLLLIAACTGRHIIIAPRGELHEGALRLKPHKKHPYLFLIKRIRYGLITWHATDQKELDCVLKLFPKARVGLVPVVFAPDTPKALTERIQHQKITNQLKLVFISRITPKKGLQFLLTVLQRMAGYAIALTIYGPTENPEYWRTCRKLIEQLPETCTVTYGGMLTHEQINSTLIDYDFFVLPTHGENFGHAIFEALSAGVPVIISDQTQWRHLPAQQAGYDVPLDLEPWMSVLREATTMSGQAYDGLTAGAKRVADAYIKSENFEEKYRQLFS